jgi:hypothetical protein
MNSALRKIYQIPCPLSRAPCPSLAEAGGMRRKTEHHTSHLALCTVFLMFTSLMPNDFGAKPLHLLALLL